MQIAFKTSNKSLSMYFSAIDIQLSLESRLAEFPVVKILSKFLQQNVQSLTIELSFVPNFSDFLKRNLRSGSRSE